MEKSDLKYPLIHGQGRQVSAWASIKNSSSVAPWRWGLYCALLLAVASVLGSAPLSLSPGLLSPCVFSSAIA